MIIHVDNVQAVVQLVRNGLSPRARNTLGSLLTVIGIIIIFIVVVILIIIFYIIIRWLSTKTTLSYKIFTTYSYIYIVPMFSFAHIWGYCRWMFTHGMWWRSWTRRASIVLRSFLGRARWGDGDDDVDHVWLFPGIIGKTRLWDLWWFTQALNTASSTLATPIVWSSPPSQTGKILNLPWTLVYI